MNSFYFYTETAFHHQGDLEYAKKLIIASKEAGAGGIKFQVLTKCNDFISSRHTAYKDLSSWCFSYDQWHEIFSFTKECGLDIIMMPLNIQSLELLNDFTVKFIEIHSVSFNDTALHQKIKAANVDLIIGVGGRTIDEIEKMKSLFGQQLKVLMTGFQSFPSKLEDIKLGRIAELKKQFAPLQIGYTDHSAFDNEFAVISNDYAFLLGATVFEKHITLNEGEERVDFSAAVSKEKISESIKRLDFLDKYVVVPEKEYSVFNEAELKYRNRQLTCVANREIAKGEIISNEDIGLKLIDTTEQVFTKKDEVVNKKTVNTISFDSPFLLKDLA